MKALKTKKWITLNNNNCMPINKGINFFNGTVKKGLDYRDALNNNIVH